MQKLALRTLMLLALVGVPCVAGAAHDDAVTEVPFVFEKGHVIVQVKIKGEQLVDVMMATGAEHSLIDFEMLGKYKLAAYYTGEGIITGSSLDRTYSFTTVPEIRVGGIKMSALNMRLGSMADKSKRLGRQIFGIFGADFFKGRVVQFDFAKKVVRFLPQSPDAALKDKQATSDASGRVVLPMMFFKEDVTLPVVENVTFDGKKIKTLFDTGTVAVIALSSSATKQLGLTPPPEKNAPRTDKINSLRFVDYEMTGVPVSLYPKGSDFDRDNKEFGAIVGTILLQNFVATFDFRKKLIILEHL